MTEDQLAVFIGSGLRLAMPILLAGSGELLSQRAGVLNLSLDGMMLTAAFAAALAAWLTKSPMVGLLVGVMASLVFAFFQAILSVTLRANQLVVGIGFNILALGATTFLYREIFGPLSRDTIPGFFLAPHNLETRHDIPQTSHAGCARQRAGLGRLLQRGLLAGQFEGQRQARNHHA